MIIYRITPRLISRLSQFSIRRGLKISKEKAPDTRTRNIGIIAHIDAGKTTVSERLLYLTGLTNTIGDVDTGDTITDFMDLERERGITIQSAAVTSFWRKHRINLIDTPGHVDFTVEVERCLRVLDGVVTVLDGSAGVQAQTLTVWRQAKKFQHPAVFFVNKMDKFNADFDMSVESVESRLSIPVCVISRPLYENDKFTSIIDVVNRQSLNVTKDKAKWTSIQANSREYEDLCEATENLYSKIADVDESFAELVLNAESYLHVSPDEIKKAIRRATLSRFMSPIACGSALRSTSSVTQVLDMVVDFLPSPIERDYQLPDSDLCALVFKISHDKRKGRLGYLRVYKGAVGNHQLLNVNRQTTEAGLRLYTPYSDDLEPTTSVTAGNIAVVSGLKHTVTGDTLINAVDSLGKRLEVSGNLHKYKLEGIETPEPVFFCSIEPPNMGSMPRMIEALKELSIEDPSLRVREDNELMQTVIEGMGELHIEIIKERLRREYNLDVFLGELQVSYKEILKESLIHSTRISDKFSQEYEQFCEMSLYISPSDKPFRNVDVILSKSNKLSTVRKDWTTTISQGCQTALYTGPILGSPIPNVDIELKNLNVSGGKISSAILCACANRCVKEALEKARSTVIVMEPIMRLEVTIFNTGKDGLVGAISSILTDRRGEIIGVDVPEGNKLTIVKADIPLSQTTGLSTAIRSITSGMGSLHLELSGYREMPQGVIGRLQYA